MDNAGYATLTRQSALMSELRLVANNVANASTTGFRREGIVFSEFVVDLGKEAPSMSMARAAVRATSAIQGELKPTGGRWTSRSKGRDSSRLKRRTESP